MELAFNQANAYWTSGQLDLAEQGYRSLLQIAPRSPEVLNNLGVLLFKGQKMGEAEQLYRQALDARPAYLDAHNNLTQLLLEGDRPAPALVSATAALALAPGNLKALLNSGNAHYKNGQIEAARHAFLKAASLHPTVAEPHSSLGILYHSTQQLEEAEKAYLAALQLQPEHSPTHNNLANTLGERGLHDRALHHYRESLRLDPDNLHCVYNLGCFLVGQLQFSEARTCLAQVVKTKPDWARARGLSFYAGAHLCDWQNRAEEESAVIRAVDNNLAGITPFSALIVSTLPGGTAGAFQRRAAEVFARNFCQSPGASAQPAMAPVKPHDRLRIAYLSSDFFTHATLHLLRGVLAGHDRQQFAVYGYSYGKTKDADTAQSSARCEFFRDISSLSDDDAAAQMKRDEIDILVDLKGFTKDQRVGISARRAAPVVVNWLGYPGTLGEPTLADYVIGDPVVTPPASAGDFSETLALMPHCYQPNDRQRQIAEKPSRSDAGLPEKAFVFCCFNQSYKFNPDTFDLWCKVLLAVPGSVLWLLSAHETTVANLRHEAALRGLEPQRLVFAQKLPLAEHLARLQLADLALDTFPYTSHTTGSDALWAGVPLVTKSGDSFVSRVAASLLCSMHLPDLVVTDNAQYFALASELALVPQRLAAVKQRLAHNRLTTPLFDTARFTADLEQLYGRMWKQHQKGVKKILLPEASSTHQMAEPDAALSTVAGLANAPSAVVPAPGSSAYREAFKGCPLCGSADETHHGTADARKHALYCEPLPHDLVWLRCNACGHIHTQHFWTPAGLAVLFGKTHDYQSALAANVAASRSVWAPVVHNVTQLLGGAEKALFESQKSWLDVGCGDGGLVMTASEFGYVATGLDLRAATVRALTDLGYSAVEGELTTLTTAQPFSVISMMDLLVHVPLPGQALNAAAALLTPDGLLLVSCPNSACEPWRQMDKAGNNPYWVELEHHHNFSRESLVKLCREHGFKPVYYGISPRYKAGMEMAFRRVG